MEFEVRTGYAHGQEGRRYDVADENADQLSHNADNGKQRNGQIFPE